MTEKSTVYIHIGFAKAASTSLQTFFGASKDLYVIDGYQSCLYSVTKNSLAYSHTEAFSFFSAEIDKAQDMAKIPVISHERLVGNPHSGHYDAKEIADRLYSLFPSARVIISIREQISILASIYKQYVRIGGVKNLKDYLLPTWDMRVPLFDWQIYQYHHLISYYIHLFGKAMVMVLLTEELKQDPHAYFLALANFMKISLPDDDNFDLAKIHNPGLPDSQIKHQRICNFFQGYRISLRDPYPLEMPFMLKMSKLIDALLSLESYDSKHPVDHAVRNLFQGKFIESNHILSQLIGKDLTSFGYEMLPKEGDG